jgi:protein TonB
MEIKKYPDAILENYSKILIQLGLVLALFIVYEFIEMKSYPRQIEALSVAVFNEEDDEELVKIVPVEVLKPPTTSVAISDKIIKVEDDIEIQEIIIESTEIDESDAVIVDMNKDIVVVEEEEEVVEDVPFVIIEEVPIFPGCTGNREQLRNCFSDQISKFILKKFNVGLASDLGLQTGSIQKIFVMFKIDRDGKIANIRARAPHKKLQNEAIRVVSLLPTMTPGKQRGRAVGVSYGLPIIFRIE